MAKRNMYLKKWEHGIRRLSKFPKDHWLYAEALMTLGSIYALKGDANLAHKTYQSCVEEANKREKKSEYNTQKYFAMIKESCFIDQARIYYRSGEFQKAVDHYRKVPKTSYKWPYILIEMAWAHYNLGDYNRSLGLLITYNSPLLQSYFMPEAEVLKALNYFKLCLYQDALIVVQNFYDVYKPKSDQLLSVITKGQKDPLYYYNLMFSPLEDIEKESQFLRNIVTQTSTRVKFNLDINSLQALEVEILRGNKMVNPKRLSNMQKDLKEQINHYVKVSFHKFINEIHKLSYEMFNIKLEVLSQQRDLVYKNKDLDANRSRGSLDNVKRGYKEEFWMFKQEFWADELGDYSFGLKSACEKKGA